ncbi:hypothetical protein EH165_07325 [Nakamurella antarctica]|uniref:Uncharacterized protein n=1 Tax=Nakamurella antarctica TaxID=1902245 RepID=A0A3G8ZLF0_9ACTN|nr:hypothetical protein [Nakamurella antarctica]AZI57978.1 hypothetical protein EH165_07325 [Nakamurella antarctica]
MTNTLQQILLTAQKRPHVVADVRALIDSEVAGKGGVSGLMLKAGFAAAKAIKPGVVLAAVDGFLDELVGALDPFYQQYGLTKDVHFGQYLAGRSDESSEALLTVTDAWTERTSRDGIKKIYGTLRPSAKKHVVDALPQLGAIIEKYAATS